MKLGVKLDRKVEHTTGMQVVTMSGCNHSYVWKLHISYHKFPEIREEPSFLRQISVSLRRQLYVNN